MSLIQIDFNSFGKQGVRQYDLTNFDFNEKRVLSYMEKSMKEEFNDLNDENTLKMRHEYFEIEGTQLNDYGEHYIDLGNEKAVICGIRHWGANKNFPFVAVQTNFLCNKEELKNIYNKNLKHLFKVFNPRWIRFFSSKKLKGSLIGSVEIVSNKTFFDKLVPWELEADIRFENISDNSYYTWYKEAYVKFHENYPDLKHKVTVNSLETMERSIKDNLLKEVFFKEKRCGLIAGESIELLGHSGIYFDEILIFEAFKGMGLAKAIQRKFVSMFCPSNTFTWGHIDFNNKPSLNTALRNGRQIINYECFVEI